MITEDRHATLKKRESPSCTSEHVSVPEQLDCEDPTTNVAPQSNRLEEEAVTNELPKPPRAPKQVRVYISYARGGQEQNQSVAAFTSWLRDQGIDAICDLFHSAEVSRNAPAFIEASMNEADFIIAICTPAYMRCWKLSSAQQNSSNRSNKASETELTNFEILLVRNLLFKAEQKTKLVLVELAKKKNGVQSEASPALMESVPVVLQGVRMYKIGSLNPEQITDQRDLLYQLYDKPLYMSLL